MCCDNLLLPAQLPGGSSVELMGGNPREEAFSDQFRSTVVNSLVPAIRTARACRMAAMKDLGPNETMILDADGSGKGPWDRRAQGRLYTATWTGTRGRAAGDAAGGD